MQDLILSKRLEPMVFSPDLLQDSNWAYLNSQEVEKNVTVDVSLGEGQASAAKSSAHGNLFRGSQPGGAQAQRSGQPQAGKHAEQEVFDRLQCIIDTEDPRFEKLKQENIKFWEQGAASLCDSMNQGVHRFYARKSLAYGAISQRNNRHREEYVPVEDEYVIDQELVDAAVRPWTFGSLPATGGLKISSATTETKQIPELVDRLKQMQALDLWHEPVDLLETGEGLFNGCTELLMDLAAKSEALLAEKAPAPGTPTFAPATQAGTDEKLIEKHISFGSEEPGKAE